MTDDPYAMLGVDRAASAEEITEAYRALVQIYHPDRYAGAPPRVQAEANKRMQALNAAYDQARRNARAASPHSTPPSPPPRREERSTPPPGWEEPAPRSTSPVVHYVDGSRGYHDGNVAPLGFARQGAEVVQRPDAKRCPKLDRELLQWFELQRDNATLSAKALYSSWTSEEQSLYAAKLGCTQVPREKAKSLGVPCRECAA